MNYFVLGVEKYTENLLEEALQLLTVSYVVNERIGEEPPTAQNPPCKVGGGGRMSCATHSKSEIKVALL